MHRDLTRVRRRLERDESSEHTRIDDGHRSTAPGKTPVPGKPSPEAERLARIRAEQVAQHLDAASKAFAAGHFEEAIEHTYRASAVDEEDPKPQELRARAQAALDDQHAQRFLDDAQSALDRGEVDAADSLVARAIEVRPGHTGIGVMREAVARARNQVALAAVMQRARVALEQRDFTAAIRATAEAELYQSGLEEARAIRQRAQAAIDEQAARERARQDRVRHAVEQARRAIVHGAFDEARAHAEQAARDRADTRILDGLRTEIEVARQAAESQARRSAQAAALLGEAMARFDAGEFRAAIVRCDAALRVQPDEPHALDLRRRAHQALEEEEERKRQEAEAERRRQLDEAARRAREEHDRAAQAELDAARAEFDAGRHDTAIGRLQRFAPPHDAVTHGIAALRAELAELRARAEAQARAEREERARRQAEEQRQREEAARQAEEEQRAARAARAAALAETSRELASAGQYPQALATLTEATRLDPNNPALQELARQIREAKAAQDAAERRARELAGKIAEAESRLGSGDVAKARKATDAAAALDPQAPALQALYARIAEAEARAEQQRVEQQRAAEAARQAQEAARQAKERDQKVSALIAKARKAKKPDDALRLLEEGQRIDPQRPELGALIAERHAEIAHRPPPPPPPAPRPAPGPARPLHGPTPPETRQGLPLAAVLGGVAALVALVGGGTWYFWPKPDPPPIVNNGTTDPDPPDPPPDSPVVTPSTVRIVVAPWANARLTPIAGGDALTCQTPCQLEVPPGDYDLSLENGGLSRPLSERLSVPAGQPLEVRRTMPGFDVDRAVATIVR
jgi:tetratricopeptide (TPR) repeat protein